MLTIVKLPSGRYVNLTNMTDASIDQLSNILSIRICWNYALGSAAEAGAAADYYHRDDATAIIDALDALADAAKRSAL